jgi:ribosome-binding protein aMBF1 (putative translation factor)
MSKSKIVNFSEHLDKKYGKTGTWERDEYERKSHAFRLGVMIQEARKKANMTQKELADKAHTKKSYISRVERDASDIRLSTLTRIVEKGLGGKLNISFDLPHSQS